MFTNFENSIVVGFLTIERVTGKPVISLSHSYGPWGKVWIVLNLIVLVAVGCRHESPPGERQVKDSTDRTSNVIVDLSEDMATENIAEASASTRPVPGIVRWEAVPPLKQNVAIMETVFWEPADTESLRNRIFSTPQLAGSRVLEIGTGSGLVSLCCLQAGAGHVVATDVNPNAIHNVRYNTLEAYGNADKLDARLVPRRSPGAWTVIKDDERFDFIISNPPWEDSKPTNVEEFALYDPEFLLLDSIVTGARQRLRPGGRVWLAYGCITAIRRIETLARQQHLQYLQLDDRSLDELPEVFLPGMLLELKVADH